MPAWLAGSGRPTCRRRTWITKLLKLRPSARAKASNLCLRSTGHRIDADCLMGHVVAQSAPDSQQEITPGACDPYKRSARNPLRNPRLRRPELGAESPYKKEMLWYDTTSEDGRPLRARLNVRPDGREPGGGARAHGRVSRLAGHRAI